MLSVENISYEVGKKQILQGITASFEPGQFHLILGPNGAGKSSLVKLLAGQTKPSTGRVCLESQDLTSFSTLELSRFRAVLSQQMEIPFAMRAKEIVIMGRYPHFAAKPSFEDFRTCEEAMELFEMQPFSEQYYHTLSGGEKQRVQFARVWAQLGLHRASESKRYLFLDEPLTFLDIYHQLHLMQKIREILSPQLVVVGVIHDLQMALRFADRIILLSAGKILAQGTVTEVMTPEILKQAFHVDARVVFQEGQAQLLFS